MIFRELPRVDFNCSPVSLLEYGRCPQDTIRSQATISLRLSILGNIHHSNMSSMNHENGSAEDSPGRRWSIEVCRRYLIVEEADQIHRQFQDHVMQTLTTTMGAF